MPNTDPYALTPDAIRDPPVSLWAALRQIGPGIILAGSIIGSGELLLTTSLGAEYGFVFLWLILFSCVVKVFVQIELGRYAVSSGQPTLTALNAFPGPRLGTHWLVWWWLGMTLATVSQLGAMAGGVGQALHLAMPQATTALADSLSGWLPSLAETIRAQPEHPWAVLTAIAAILLLLRGGYRRIELLTTFMVAGVTSITVICVLALPGLGYPIGLDDVREGFSFSESLLAPAAIAAAFGAFGITGVGAAELYAYPYWCLEKGYARYTGPRTPDDAWAARARGWVRVLRLDAWVSMVVFTIATVSFYSLGATVLHRQHLHPHKQQMIATLSEMYVPAFGDWTKIVFLIGVWAVLFKTLYVASASHARLTADFVGLLGLAGDDDADDEQAGHEHGEWRSVWIRRFCIFYPALGLMLYLWIGDPKAMVIFGGFFQAATLPVIAASALYLRYRRMDPRLATSLWADICLWLAFASISVVAIYAIGHWLLHDAWPAISAWATA